MAKPHVEHLTGFNVNRAFEIMLKCPTCRPQAERLLAEAAPGGTGRLMIAPCQACIDAYEAGPRH